MSKLFVVGLASLLAVSAFAAEYKQGEVIVKYKQGARSRLMMNAMYDAMGVKKVRRISQNLEQLSFSETIKVTDAVAKLSKDPSVEYAQPNFILRINPIRKKQHIKAGGIPCIPGYDIPGCDPNATMPCIIPGIPFPPGCTDGDNPNPPSDPNNPTPPPASRPALQDPPAEVNPPVVDPDLNKAWGLGKIQAPEAWKIHSGSKDFIVADIDTGIDYNHEDLAFNVWRNPNPDKGDTAGFDFIHNDGLPFDDQNHGSHTAGTIGATGGNGVGVSGVIPRVSLMGLKFLSAEGSGTTADAIRAIDYAIAHNARVLSNSWGGKGDPENSALGDAIVRAQAKGVLFIAAAGNDGTNNDTDPTYPAAFTYDNMITVAATDDKDGMAYFSNYGAKTAHLGAPGVNVYSTVPGNKYDGSYSGTSMACPHVAGAAALVWSAHPAWDYKKVKEVLMNSADPVASLKGKTQTGGRLNVLKALQQGLRSTE